jgi:hypothetical protein
MRLRRLAGAFAMNSSSVIGFAAAAFMSASVRIRASLATLKASRRSSVAFSSIT